MLSKITIILCLTLFPFHSFCMDINGEKSAKTGVISYKAVELEENFGCDDVILKNHIVDTINQKKRVDSISSKDSTNLLRVNLYAYNDSDESWYFFSDNNIYASSWYKEPLSLKNKKYKATIDRNTQEGLTNIYLGTIYGYEISSANSDKDKTLTIPKQKSREIIDAFKKRNCNPGESFDIQGYSHSEQAFISWVYDYASKNNIDKEISQFKNMVLLFSSKNEQCKKCLNTLGHMLTDGQFRKNILDYFTAVDTNPEKLKDKSPVVKPDHFNIFYSYLKGPPIKQNFEFDKKFYTLPIVTKPSLHEMKP